MFHGFSAFSRGQARRVCTTSTTSGLAPRQVQAHTLIGMIT
jgi:hypothetical protein